jgi:sporulation protein YlmC with PRC-barrel domain
MQRSNIWSASTIIGYRVRNAAGENLGKVEDVVLDPVSGSIVYAVLSFGGFLGMGDKLFAIPWESLSPAHSGDYLILDVDKETLQHAEGFDPSNWPDLMDPAWQNRTRRYFGSHDSSPMRPVPKERPVVVDREVHHRTGSSVVAVVLLTLLLVGLGWLSYKISTQGWEQTKNEIRSTFQGAAYAMKETTEDATLTGKVQTSFSLSRRIPTNARINVDSQDGVVTLRGEVPSQDVRTHAEELARDVPGVSQVRNHLYVIGDPRN